MQRKKSKIIVPLVMLSMILFSCGEDPTTPRPPGYFRIDLPSHEYDTAMCSVYSFMKNKAASFGEVENKESKQGIYTELLYKKLRATFYFSYFEPDTNLSKLIDDCHALAYNHTGKADDIVPVKVSYHDVNVH